MFSIAAASPVRGVGQRTYMTGNLNVRSWYISLDWIAAPATPVESPDD
jgi:hypothetical protein